MATIARSRTDRNHQVSTGELVKRASEQLSEVVRSEMRLARAEMKEKGKRAGLGGGMFGGAALFGLLALQVLVAAAVAAVALALSVWLAALVVAGGLLLVAGLLALVGRSQMSRAKPAKPEQALGGVRADVQAIREGAHR
ncbi:phage holin family protein [Streptomyces sp. JJ36]|uniref:phage holin family protein n=1 Tax=Streptomyces sp. JJ36 TaxID=2736645 RepID=UPI001F303D15|nr:phage holin family protein [Streptomyces sp. JJ36]MCF6523159.1 phage holin family protein [Streptomyces sp. JJ36]